jgi:hypothetical protein
MLYMQQDGQASFNGQWSVSHESWRGADTVTTLIWREKLDDGGYDNNSRTPPTGSTWIAAR